MTGKALTVLYHPVNPNNKNTREKKGKKLVGIPDGKDSDWHTTSFFLTINGPEPKFLLILFYL
jgi:hypothetical protein